jgi:hypothetical protein
MKKYIPTLIPIVVAGAAIVAQAGQSYLSQHPHATAAGFFAALGLAIVNHWITSPKDAV